MNLKEEQAKLRDKFQRLRQGLPPLRKVSVAVENRRTEAKHQRQAQRQSKRFASGKEVADAIGQIFD